MFEFCHQNFLVLESFELVPTVKAYFYLRKLRKLSMLSSRRLRTNFSFSSNYQFSSNYRFSTSIHLYQWVENVIENVQSSTVWQSAHVANTCATWCVTGWGWNLIVRKSCICKRNLLCWLPRRKRRIKVDMQVPYRRLGSCWLLVGRAVQCSACEFDAVRLVWAVLQLVEVRLTRLAR